MDQRHSDEIFGMLSGMSSVLHMVTTLMLKNADRESIRILRDASLEQANGRIKNENDASPESIYAASQFSILYLEGFWDRVEAQLARK